MKSQKSKVLRKSHAWCNAKLISRTQWCASPLVAQCPDKFLHAKVVANSYSPPMINIVHEFLYIMETFFQRADAKDMCSLQNHRYSWQEDGNLHREEIIIVGLVLSNRSQSIRCVLLINFPFYWLIKQFSRAKQKRNRWWNANQSGDKIFISCENRFLPVTETAAEKKNVLWINFVELLDVEA